jgi:hypothetical protein
VAALVTVTGSAASLSVTSQHFTLARSCTLTAYPSASTVDIDSTVDQNNPTTNTGTATTLTVASKNAGLITLSPANLRSYVRFDLTKCVRAAPSTATVMTASLRLYATALASSCRTYDVFRVGSSWTETGITWNNQPGGSSLNSPASSSRTSAVTAGTGGGCTYSSINAYMSLDVTSDVVAFVTGSATNNGWEIRDDAETGGGLLFSQNFTAIASSREASVQLQAPQLVITYR